jgi:phospholipase C
VRHVVLLMLENRSFDQMLGCFKSIYPNLEGVNSAQPGANTAPDGTVYKQAPTTERQMLLDPRHEVDHVRTQLADSNGGFVRDLAAAYEGKCTATQLSNVMGYYPLDFLPALHALAHDFMICDHWFSSLPGPTWPNRFFALSGTSCGRVNMPDDGAHRADLAGWFEQDQDTIFDRLSARGIPWKVYFHSIPQTIVLMHQRRPVNAARYFPIDHFFADARGAESLFPSFTLIEPDFMGARENDDHPPHDIMKAQKLIADVYNALRSNASLWESTLLIVTYDEHGGFYDHVVPPSASPPDCHKDEYTFDQLGVRVPTVLVSPWVEKGFDATVYDHTSVLRYLIEKWGLEPLGHRATESNNFAPLLQRLKTPRTDSVPWITLSEAQLLPPNPALEEQAEAHRSGHHESLEQIVEYLKLYALDAAPTWYARIARFIERLKAMMARARGVAVSSSRAASDRDAAMNVTMGFMRQQKAKAVPELAGQLRDGASTERARKFAAEGLAHIVGVRFHAAPDSAQVAEEWLQRQRR